MTPEHALHYVIGPTLELLGARYDSREAETMLVAIALQESRFVHRAQIGGPARGYWQFERGGGVRGVLRHDASKAAAAALCAALDYQPQEDIVYSALQHNDMLACGFARLLLYTDAATLPRSEASAWDYYIRNWRPGKPHPETWAECWRRAVAAV